LLHNLATIARNTCVSRTGKTASRTFELITKSTAAQHRALQALRKITM